MTKARAPLAATRVVELGGGDPYSRPELLLDRRLGDRLSPASLALLRDQAQRLWRRIDRCPGLYLPRAAGVALAALIAYQGAALYGVIVTPLDDRPELAVRPPQLQPETLLASFDPFFTGGGDPAVPLAPTDLTLHGFRQDRRTGGGSAIISGSDGAQRSFATGEEVAPGIVLKQVGFDHVIIARNGLESRLAFSEFERTGPAALAAVSEARSPHQPAPAASPAAGIPARRPGRPATASPPRSIDFADPATLPASLTSGSAPPDPRSTSKR